MNPAPIDEVVDLLRTLRLPHMRAAAPELLATAKAQRWDPAEAVKALLAEELAGRQASSIRARRKAAGFPTGKTFDIWDEAVSSVPAPTQRALRTLEWIHRHENLVVCGPSGTPKTHFLEALGQAAVDAGHKVTWFSLEHLGALVRRHSADDTTAKAIRRIMRSDVIAIDDIGLLPVTTETAEALYRVVDAAYEKHSIALSRNLHPAKAHTFGRTCARSRLMFTGSNCRGVRRRHRRLSSRGARHRSCPRPSPTPPSTGSCTTPTLSSPPATASASPKPPPERG